jgi:methanol metabolism-related c-type cytochrome
MQPVLRAILVASALLALPLSFAYALTDGSGDPAAVKSEDGKWFDKSGNPTFKVEPDGTVDWYTYIGFIRYSSECLRCHGPDGMGSTYAPALIDSMKHLTHSDFYATVAGGKNAVSASQNLVMPAQGDNKNVMCFIDEIYSYLRGRSDGAVARGRPEKHASKPPGFEKAQDQCMD